MKPTSAWHNGPFSLTPVYFVFICSLPRSDFPGEKSQNSGNGDEQRYTEKREEGRLEGDPKYTILQQVSQINENWRLKNPSRPLPPS